MASETVATENGWAAGPRARGGGIGLVDAHRAARAACCEESLSLRSEFRLQIAEIQGFSPDGSILVVEHKPDNAANTLILRDMRIGPNGDV